MLYFILLLVIVGIAFYLTMRQYLLTPRYHYKERVMLLTIELHHRLDDAKYLINRTAQDKEEKKKAIQKDFGDRYLRSITVDALDDFEGIGPFIINKLKEENYKTLLDFTTWKNLTTGKIPGIGGVRWKAITDGVEKLRTDANAKIAAGDIPEGKAMQAKLAEVDRDLDRRERAAKADITALLKTVEQLQPHIDLVNRITFLKFLQGKKPAELTDEIMNGPLPTLPEKNLLPDAPPKVESLPQAKLAPPEIIMPVKPKPAPIPEVAPVKKAKPTVSDPFAEYEPTTAAKPIPAPSAARKVSPPKPVAPPVEDYRAILEIDPKFELSADLIRRQYTQLAEKTDPAKVKSMGEEFVTMAEQKRAKIRQAAESLIAPFGEPLEKVVVPPPSDIRHNPDLDAVFG